MWHNIIQNCGGRLRTMPKGVGCVWFPLKFGNIDISKMLDPRLLGKIYFKQACFYFEEGEKNEL